MRFERQPGRPLDLRTRRATHDSQGPPCAVAVSGVSRSRDDAVRHSILASRLRLGEAATRPRGGATSCSLRGWSRTATAGAVAVRTSVQQPLDRRTRRATHDPQGPPWRSPLQFAVQREPLPRDAVRRPTLAPTLGSGERRHAPGVERPTRSVVGRGPRRRCAVRASVQLPLDRRTRRTTHDSQGPPWSPLQYRRAGVSRSRETPCAARILAPTLARGSGDTPPGWSDHRRRRRRRTSVQAPTRPPNPTNHPRPPGAALAPSPLQYRRAA
jgi:hypothetical protein